MIWRRNEKKERKFAGIIFNKGNIGLDFFFFFGECKISWIFLKSLANNDKMIN